MKKIAPRVEEPGEPQFRHLRPPSYPEGAGGGKHLLHKQTFQRPHPQRGLPGLATASGCQPSGCPPRSGGLRPGPRRAGSGPLGPLRRGGGLPGPSGGPGGPWRPLRGGGGSPYPPLASEAATARQRPEEGPSASHVQDAILAVQQSKLTQVATYKTLASRLKLWAKMKPHTLSTKPWRVVACMRLGNSSVRVEPTDSMILLPKVAMS